MRFSRECGLCHMCASCLLDIMRNKLEWVGAGTSTTEKRPPAIAGVDGIDSQRVCDVASGVLRRLCNRVPRGQDCRRAGPQATERKLLFILVYQKAYPLQALLGEVFGLSQSRANRWIQRLLPILKQALDELEVLPSREPGHFAEQERGHQEAAELIIDGTDRRRQRPKNPVKQASHYSGKHKAHSDKNVVVVNAKTKRVGYLSQTYAGKIHDKKIADSEPICYPPATILYKDTGFQGYEPNVRQTHQPKKSHPKAH